MIEDAGQLKMQAPCLSFAKGGRVLGRSSVARPTRFNLCRIGKGVDSCG